MLASPRRRSDHRLARGSRYRLEPRWFGGGRQVARSSRFFRGRGPGHADPGSEVVTRSYRRPSPASLGFDADRLKRIDAAIDRAIERGQVPGAVVLVGRRGLIAYARAAGRRVVGPMPEPMTRDTVFDMASLTKPVATATSVMILIEEGKLRLTDRLGRALPEFDNHGKGAITIEQLLRHRAGLIPDNPIADYQRGARSGLEADSPSSSWSAPPGERFRYSDVGFLILGRLVEQIGGQPLDRFASGADLRRRSG